MLSVGALFAGIGGIELGLERTGYFKARWFVEIDPFCQRILRKHWPDIPIYGDVRAIDWGTMPRVDMLTGGFPCQDISTANPRGKGIEGSRSGLWSEYAEAIGILRPRYALIENVPAIVRKGLNVVLADLAEAGYDAEWLDLRASDFGALHRRERIFVVAYNRHEGEVSGGSDGKIRATWKNEIGETPECIVANPHNDGQQREGVLLLPRGPQQTDPCDKECSASNPQIVGQHHKFVSQDDGQTPPSLNPHGHENPLQHTNRIIADDYRDKLSKFIAKKNLSKEGFVWCQNIRKVEDLTGRPDLPQPLFRGGRDGVPDWVDRIRALGNAVVPECAEFIGELIMEFDKGHPP